MQSAAKLLGAAAAALAVAVLVWQAAAGAWTIASYFARDVTCEGLFDSEEERLARAFGEHYETYRILRDTVPEDSIVYCNLLRPRDDPHAARDLILLDRLRHALHPRYVRGFDIDSPQERATLTPDPRLFVCDFEPDSGPRPPEFMTLWRRAERLALWGVGEPR